MLPYVIGLIVFCTSGLVKVLSCSYTYASCFDWWCKSHVLIYVLIYVYLFFGRIGRRRQKAHSKLITQTCTTSFTICYEHPSTFLLTIVADGLLWGFFLIVFTCGSRSTSCKCLDLPWKLKKRASTAILWLENGHEKANGGDRFGLWGRPKQPQRICLTNYGCSSHNKLSSHNGHCPVIKLSSRDRPKPKFWLSAETEYSAEAQLFCKEQNSRIPNSTYHIVQIFHYSVSAEYSVLIFCRILCRNRVSVGL